MKQTSPQRRNTNETKILRGSGRTYGEENGQADSETKFTPGEWKSEVRLAQAIVTDQSGNMVAEVCRNPDGGSSGEQTYLDETIEANARLIASAPQLFAMLRAALPQLERFESTDPNGERCDNPVLNQARTLLASVQGKGEM